MPTRTGRFAALASSSRLIGLVGWVALIALVGGCATRSVRSPIIDRMGVQVDLVRQVKGFTTQPLGYDHPTIISVVRMAHILNAVEIETREKGKGAIRQPAFHPEIVEETAKAISEALAEAGPDQAVGVEIETREKGKGAIRQPAFHPEIVEETAKAISEALAEAGPDQEVGVKIIRKEMRFGVFHKKFLTSFLVHVSEDHLYLSLHRIEWFVSRRNEDSLPEPRRDTHPMDFRVVSGEHLYYAGPQALEIDWQNPVFQTAYRLPGSSRGEKRRREVIDESPVPRSEREETSNRENRVAIDELSPDQLRALADLEDDRREGRITETAYQRAKRQLLRQR